MDIKQKIRELVPDAGETFGLAVVLRAIIEQDLEKLFPDEKYPFTKASALTVAHWNLEHDNYDDQSQETKDFIGSLLTPYDLK